MQLYGQTGVYFGDEMKGEGSDVEPVVYRLVRSWIYFEDEMKGEGRLRWFYGNHRGVRSVFCTEMHHAFRKRMLLELA